MGYGFTEIDHLLASARDPRAGGEQYERLGFTVTPLSVIENLGVGNRLVLMQPLAPHTANFFECMGVVDPARADTPMGRLLSGPEGVRSMVLSGPDAMDSYYRLARGGFPFQPPMDIKRDWRLPSGEILTPAFLVTVPIAAPLGFNFCQYRTLHYYLRDEWLRHTNGAISMTKVFAVAADARGVADYFAKVFAKPHSTVNGAFAVGPGVMQLVVGDRTSLRNFIPAHWVNDAPDRPRYVGFEVTVASLTEVHMLLAARNVEFVEHGDALVVAPKEACGNVLRIVEHRRP